jgi:filamentous hemagglutinin family protein
MSVGRRTIVGLLVGCCYAPVLHSDVVRDGSIGPDASVQPQGPDYVIPETMGEFAPGSSANLFHSFGEFSLSSLQSATFTGPAAVQNILARVTGGVPSTIDGLLSSQIAGADLFLVNPQGVMFGENARLDVNGSFYATTADGVRLGTSGDFAATNPGSTVLSVEPPAAFYFLGNGPVAPIMVNEPLLIVPEGETLGLIGGDLTVLGQDHAGEPVGEFSTLVASGGKVVLSSVASSGEVDLGGNPTGFDGLGAIRLAAPGSLNEFEEGGNLVLDASGDPGGTVVIRGGQLVMEQGGAISGATRGDADHAGVAVDIDVAGDVIMRGFSEIGVSTFGLGDAGDVLIRAGGDFAMIGDTDSPAYGGFGNNANIGSRTFGFVDADGNTVGGNAGTVDISADSILMEGLAFIQSDTFSSGDAGVVRLTAADRIDLISTDRYVYVASQVQFDGTGDAGFVEINTGDLSVIGGDGDLFSGISVQVSGTGGGDPNAGNLVINASGNVEVLKGAQISSGIFQGSGSGGDIRISADELIISGVNVDENGEVVLGPFPSGLFSSSGISGTSATAGDIVIDTNRLVVDDGGRILAVANFPSAADAGAITIDTGSLLIANSGAIVNNSFGFGQGAPISITADEITIQGPSVTATDTVTGISAQGGTAAASASSVRIDTGSLSILDGGIIQTTTTGLATGGAIDIDADTILLSGVDEAIGIASSIISNSAIFLNFVEFSGGDGGTINIGADRLDIDAGAEIAARSFTTGRGGNINLDVGSLNVTGGGIVSVEALSTGDAGAINIQSSDLMLLDGLISAKADSADGGNILIDATRTELRESSISATVGGGAGDGGNVTLGADDYLLLDRSDITANAVGGRGGNIDITTYALIMDNDSTLSASSELGIDGTVVVNSPENEVEDAAVVATPEFTDAASLLKAQCSAAVSGQSSLVVSRGDGLPESPEGLMSLRDQGSLDVAAIPPRMLLAALDCFAP